MLGVLKDKMIDSNKEIFENTNKKCNEMKNLRMEIGSINNTQTNGK